jgi:DnaK suppressor protein
MHEADTGGDQMDVNRAQELLLGQRTEVLGALNDMRVENADDRDAEAQSVDDAGDIEDRSQPLEQEDDDAAITDELNARLEAIDRALQRIKDGTYGLSVESGKPIPDERLEADPAAELTIEEARAAERR